MIEHALNNNTDVKAILDSVEISSVCFSILNARGGYNEDDIVSLFIVLSSFLFLFLSLDV